MNDYGTRHTDLAVKRAEWRLSRVYHQAAKDIEDKMKAWEKGHAAREAQYRQQVKDGKITQADFDAWMRGQVFQGQQWQARKDEIENILLNADKAAANIVNEGKLGIFTTNANYIGYELEDHGSIDTGFTLYDENTVARLVKSDPQILPKAREGVKKDKAYSYYNKLMNSAVTQGIIQGETIPQIAKRIAHTTGERGYTSAVRNARTAFTGAQNAGRIEGLHQAQGLGIEVKKRWMATLDDRTRDAHADLDGQIKDVDEPFDSELGPIDYPGDPTADPANVYNCRCTLVYVYPEYPSDMERRDNETGEIVGDMTYREWEDMKQGEEGAPDRFVRYADDEYDAEYQKYADKYTALEQKANKLYNETYAAYNRRRSDPDGYKVLLAEYEKTRQEFITIRNEVGAKYGIEVAANRAKEKDIEFVPLRKRGTPFDEDEIIKRLGGGDMTKGSCASLGFCWAGQRAGYDVLDFRDGDSRELFSRDCVDILKTLGNSGVPVIKSEAKSYITAGKRTLKAIKEGADGKEYYFECASHAAIVRKKGTDLQYLELQSKGRNGWKSFTERLSTEEITLNWRFGAPKSSEGRIVSCFAVDLDEMASNKRFQKLLGFINTDVSKQHKGASGHER